MRGPKPAPITLTDRQRTVLERLTRGQTTPQALVRRAHIILDAATGLSNDHIARHRGLDRGTVRTWRTRWLTDAARLEAAEGAGAPDPILQDLAAEVLADAPRPGAPDTFTTQQIVQIVALACEPPPGTDRPTSHWSPRELADEAIKRNIVPTISPRTVGRFLKSGRAQAASQPLLAQPQARRPGNLCRPGHDGV